MARNTAQAAAVPVSGAAAGADGTGVRGPYLKHIDVMRAVKQPQGLKDREQWEKFAFQVETYLAFLDGTLPDSMDKARKSKTFLHPVDLSSAEMDQPPSCLPCWQAGYKTVPRQRSCHAESDSRTASSCGGSYGESLRQRTTARRSCGAEHCFHPSFPRKRQASVQPSKND